MPDTPPTIIDARGLTCPQPVLRLRQGVQALPPGTRLQLLTSDPMASVDVRAFCLRNGHRLLAETSSQDGRCFEIETGPLFHVAGRPHPRHMKVEKLSPPNPSPALPEHRGGSKARSRD